MKLKLQALLSILLLSLFAQNAMAGTFLAPGVATMFADLTTDVAYVIDTYVWPLVTTVVGTFFIIKILKKGVGAV